MCTDGRDEANRRLSQFCKRAKKKKRRAAAWNRSTIPQLSNP